MADAERQRLERVRRSGGSTYSGNGGSDWEGRMAAAERDRLNRLGRGSGRTKKRDKGVDWA